MKERDYKFIQKHSRGLNRVPALTYIFACLNQLSYRERDIESERKEDKERHIFRDREDENEKERE